MTIERKIITENLKKLGVKEYLEKELDRAGCGEIDIQRTPLGTRVMIHAQRPGLVIGRKGSSIRRLTEVLQKEFELDNPQLEVNELEVPELNAKIMADNIASAIERGIHFRRAAYTALRRIMEAGARGAEIQISGKLTGERSKSVKFTDGYLKHCGEPAIVYVKKGLSEASPKPGVIGVKVKLMPPGVKLPDDIEFINVEEEVEEKKLKPTELDAEEASVPKKTKVKKIKKRKKKKKEAPKKAEEGVKAPEGAVKKKLKKGTRKRNKSSSDKKVKRKSKKKKGVASGDTKK
ncbi:MAG: 30S ribosomal protein S3 [Candidatus Hydrothermarchaeales archaeon]